MQACPACVSHKRYVGRRLDELLVVVLAGLREAIQHFAHLLAGPDCGQALVGGGAVIGSMFKYYAKLRECRGRWVGHGGRKVALQLGQIVCSRLHVELAASVALHVAYLHCMR